jgi:hypothetical protein
MRNRAKCKLCQSIIESFHSTDYVVCKCGEISLDAGESLRCFAKDFNNFLRVDDEGNEIVVTFKKIDDDKSKDKTESKPIYTKKDLLDMLEEQIKSIDNLPSHALHSFVTNSDLQAVLVLLLAILRADSCKDLS